MRQHEGCGWWYIQYSLSCLQLGDPKLRQLFGHINFSKKYTRLKDRLRSIKINPWPVSYQYLNRFSRLHLARPPDGDAARGSEVTGGGTAPVLGQHFDGLLCAGRVGNIDVTGVGPANIPLIGKIPHRSKDSTVLSTRRNT